MFNALKGKWIAAGMVSRLKGYPHYVGGELLDRKNVLAILSAMVIAMLLDNGGINAYLRLPKATREAKEMALAFDIAEVIQGRKGIDEATLAVMATL